MHPDVEDEAEILNKCQSVTLLSLSSIKLNSRQSLHQNGQIFNDKHFAFVSGSPDDRHREMRNVLGVDDTGRQVPSLTKGSLKVGWVGDPGAVLTISYLMDRVD